MPLYSLFIAAALLIVAWGVERYNQAEAEEARRIKLAAIQERLRQEEELEAELSMSTTELLAKRFREVYLS